MNKIFGLILTFALCLAPAFAADGILISAKESAKEQRKVSEVGFRLLNANGIQTRAMFALATTRKINAYCDTRSRMIVIYRSLYERCETEDELAAILAHEISHSVDSYNGIFRGYFSDLSYYFAPKKYEYKADKKAVDYMVNAGYNPVALIVVMNKAFPQERYDWCSTHPLTSRRMMEVYEYIYKKYPEYLAHNAYKNNIYYQNFLLTSKENRVKFQRKIESNSKRSVKYL